MWFIGMPDPMIWGLLAFILNFLPYIGAVVGVGLTGFVAMLTFDSLTWRLIPPGAYLMLTVFEANFVTPTVLGWRLPINPLVLFAWVIFWGWLWGFTGALLAVPLLVALRLSATHFRRLEFIGDLIGPSPDEVAAAKESVAAGEDAESTAPTPSKRSIRHRFGRL
jgi:predicted PurR-regulated permease PerM